MKKNMKIIENITSGLFFAALGILFIVGANSFYKFLFEITGYGLLILAILKTINVVTKRTFKLFKITDIILYLLIGLWLVISPTILMNTVTRIFGLYALLQAVSGFIDAYYHYIDKIKGVLPKIITATITLTFSILLLYSPYTNAKYFCFLVGFYLIFYGIMDIIKFFSNLRAPLPVILTMWYPKILMKKIKRENKINDMKNEDYDVEILIHLAPSGSAAMGHIEIGFENKIYSYACYNYIGRSLWGGAGDGILGIFDHDAYIKYCIEKKERFIISYGLKIKESDKEKIKESINKFIHTNTERWYPEEALSDNDLCEKRNFTEMANEIYRYANGIFYRFTKGKYKKFFVLRTNCVTSLLEMLSPVFTKIIPIEGIVTPGTYYKYLDDEFHKNKKLIVAKTLYTKELVKEKKYKYKDKIIEKINQ